MILSKRSKDYTGQKFGHLTFVKPLESSKNGIIWELLCDCGAIRKTVPANVVGRLWAAHCSQKCPLIKRDRPGYLPKNSHYK
jgi:hypothetical protein